MAEKDTFYKIIKWGLIIGIVGGLFLLIIGSIIIRDLAFIKKCPTKFIFETFLFGFLTAIPIIYIGKTRNADTAQSIEEFFILFFKVVSLHTTLQLSGIYSQIYCKSRSDHNFSMASITPYTLNPFFPVVKWGIIAMVILGLSILFIGSLAVRDIDFIKEQPGIFTSETLILAFFAAIPLFLIGRNRHAESRENFTHFLIMFAKIAIVHIGFQLSGVYSILYPDALA